MYKYLLLICFIALNCTSKNRYAPEAQTPSGPVNKPDYPQGNITEIESDAIPFFVGKGDHPNWKLKVGQIQNAIFEVQLTLEDEKQTWIGLMQEVEASNEGQTGQFLLGQLEFNQEKKEIEFYLDRKPCEDMNKKTYNARVIMLKDTKEFYGCGDFVK